MLFNSIEFLIFFPLVTILYFLLPFKYRWVHLLIASCIFYCAFVPVYILILFFTIIIDYFAGIYIEKAEGARRKMLLTVSLVANIGILVVFKYYNFFIENINELLHGLHITTNNLPYLEILLPIGLSFHTFQAMSYTIEVYRGKQPAERHFGIYSLYVMYYPQLLAGPIERSQNILHQFKIKHDPQYDNIVTGLRLMLWGMFKKVVIADNLGQVADAVFNNPGGYEGFAIIIAILFFTFQIYCDFSGYSDIAIGASRVMGIELMQNFRQPYFSKSISEFWTRWHISLSTWFKDYLYIPLGGNRVAVHRKYMNLMIVFMVSGLWHGASWTFITWGALHGCYLIIGQMVEPARAKITKGLPPLLVGTVATMITFFLVATAWVFFRASGFDDAVYMLTHSMQNITSVDAIKNQVASLNVAPINMIFYFFLIVFLLISEKFVIGKGLDNWISRRPIAVRWAFYYMLIGLIAYKGFWGETQFIYFQF